MEVLHDHQLDAVSGGFLWFGLAVFTYLNLEKLSESWDGLVDGYNAGFNGTGADPRNDVHDLKSLLQRLAAALGMRPSTLAVVLALALLFIYLQEISDSMEGFIDGYNSVWK